MKIASQFLVVVVCLVGASLALPGKMGKCMPKGGKFAKMMMMMHKDPMMSAKKAKMAMEMASAMEFYPASGPSDTCGSPPEELMKNPIAHRCQGVSTQLKTKYNCS